MKNKYQEALNIYKRLEGFPQGVIIPYDPMLFYSAEKTLQELVDKATPKKPIERLFEKNKPTEQQILKKFEELGYRYIDYRNEDTTRYFVFINGEEKIIIYFDKTYAKTDYYKFITLQEHQLLHELFTV